MASPGAEPVSQIVAAMQELPIGAHGAAAAGLAAGLILWIMGRRVIKPIFAAVGGTIGAWIGFFVAPATGWSELGGVPSPYIGLAAGAALGAVAAVLLFRFAMGVSTGVVFGVAGTLIAGVLLHEPAPPPTPVTDGLAQGWAWDAPTLGDERGLLVLARQGTPEAAPTTRDTLEMLDLGEGALEEAKSAAERARDFLKELGAEVGVVWDDLPAESRFIITASALGGAIVGFLLGLIMPNWGGAAVTSLFGAAVWLPSLVWLLHATDAPGRGVLDRGPLGWLMIWLAVSMVGLAAQTSGLRRKKKAAAEGEE